jgi:CHAT domain-containing protein
MAGLYDAERHRFLVQDYALVIAPSAGILLNSEPRSLSASRMLMFGADASTGEHGLPALPEIAREAADVVALVPGARVMMGADATKSAFLRDISTFEIVHFAGHAIASRVYPAASRLLTYTASPTSDQFVQGSDIMKLRLNRTRLVVLAACGTADGAEGTADGVRSLASLFLAAGAGSVVGGLWNVNDRAARSFFREFYGEFLTGSNLRRAMRTAQLALLQSDDPELRRPTSWAAFVATTRLLD